jgi:hypothetical protein
MTMMLPPLGNSAFRICLQNAKFKMSNGGHTGWSLYHQKVFYKSPHLFSTVQNAYIKLSAYGHIAYQIALKNQKGISPTNNTKICSASARDS